ncbi:hypothetical protein [Arcanobacterium bovis]|uniref:Single-stranded DNA-binding protein n=1 Tax=Arcanobacterium bovis TaxID=2529275 RepID=A0A4Q9V070_9ACTO|nr:hypothetical protein [Arcanobacterium bovis]TBW20772.1 hypothetical protein EZJ44_08285 [Arcanobacterium bovis]
MNRIAIAGEIVGIVRQNIDDNDTLTLTFSVHTSDPNLTTPVKVTGSLAEHLLSEHIGQGAQVLVFGYIEGNDPGVYILADRVSIDFFVEEDHD